MRKNSVEKIASMLEKMKRNLSGKNLVNEKTIFIFFEIACRN